MIWNKWQEFMKAREARMVEEGLEPHKSDCVCQNCFMHHEMLELRAERLEIEAARGVPTAVCIPLLARVAPMGDTVTRWILFVPDCPYCHGPHEHGVGSASLTAADFGGRAAHCDGGQYLLRKRDDFGQWLRARKKAFTNHVDQYGAWRPAAWRRFSEAADAVYDIQV